MNYVITKIEIDTENEDLIQITLMREKVPGDVENQDYNRIHTNYVPRSESPHFYVGQTLVLA